MSNLNPVIILDANSGDREIHQEGLRKAGCNKLFIHYTEAAELKTYLESSTRDSMPAMILLDISLPAGAGLELLKFVKKDPRFLHVPLVVLTASGEEADYDLAYELGANCYIRKPSDPLELTQITQSIALLWCLK